MPTSNDATAILPGLSPIRGRTIETHFDGALMSSDGGLLVLREVEQRLGIAGRLPPASKTRGRLSASRAVSTRSSASGCS